MNPSPDAVKINARMAARWAHRTVEKMRREKPQIDAVNVFPVADGDTGSNMYHTVRSAYRAVERLTGEVTLPQVVEAMATGALRGARGNSGLILAVALRGVADGLASSPVPDAASFAHALELAASRSQEAVDQPVNGTMLTVMEAMATEARRQADAGADLLAQIAGVRDRSQEALEETRDQLEVLAAADVVDAGSMGIVEIFDLLYLTVSGLDARPAPEPTTETAPLKLPAFLVPAAPDPEEDGLELVFHLAAPRSRVRTVKRILAKHGGNSVVVSWPMVHVHVRDEAHALALLAGCADLGLVDLRVEDLRTGPARDPLTLAVAAATGAGAMLAAALNEAHVFDPALVAPATWLPVRLADMELPAVLLAAAAEPAEALAEAARGLATDPELPRCAVVPTADHVSMLASLAVFDPRSALDDTLADMVDSAGSTRVGKVRTHHETPEAGVPDVVLVDLPDASAEESPSISAGLARVLETLVEDEVEVLTVAIGRQADVQTVHQQIAVATRPFPELVVETVETGDPGLCVEVGVQ